MPPRIAKKIKPVHQVEYEMMLRSIDRKRKRSQKLVEFNKKYSEKMKKVKDRNASLDEIKAEMEKYRIAFGKFKEKLNIDKT